MHISIRALLSGLGILCLLIGAEARAAGKPGKSKAANSRTELVAKAAAALEKMGLYHGDTSGKWNPDLHVALQAYQKGHGFNPTGRLNRETRAALGLEAERPAKGAGGARKGTDSEKGAPGGS